MESQRRTRPRARRTPNEALRRDPKNVVVYANRGDIWRLKGDLERALIEQDQSVRLDPKSPLPFVARGNTYRYKGELDRALADYDQALRLTPDYIPAFVGRGLTFEKAGDLARARAEYNKALNSKSQFRGDVAGSALETARARLAAFDSGAVQPVIPAAPARVTSSTSIPTPEVAAPAPVTVERQQARPPGCAGDRQRRLHQHQRLTNPQHDANVIATSLRAIGFETVTIANDATREKLTDALRTFSSEAAKADWAVVYYAGHGIEVNGTNYLHPGRRQARRRPRRPVRGRAARSGDGLGRRRQEAPARPARRLPRQSVRAADARTERRHRRATGPSTAVGVVGDALDRQGLGEVKVSGATLVVYAAKHGQTALDGEGGNSPFAIAMVQRLATPNVEINKLFRLVRDDVMEATAGRQEPYTYGSLPGREDFFFVQN